MELMAAIVALEQLKVPCRVKLHSDSAYLINAFKQNWFAKWLRNGWQTARSRYKPGFMGKNCGISTKT